MFLDTTIVDVIGFKNEIIKFTIGYKLDSIWEKRVFNRSKESKYIPLYSKREG